MGKPFRQAIGGFGAACRAVLGTALLLALTAWGGAARGQAFVELAAGSEFTCGLEAGGAVRCWGDDTFGQLGFGDPRRDAPSQSPAVNPPANLGAKTIQITAGEDHVCALLAGGALRCWGDGTFGQTGYGRTARIGDDEPPAAAGDVPVGGRVVQVAAGRFHTCALLVTGHVRCWGDGLHGQLGYGNRERIGDDEPAAAAGDVPLDGRVVQVATGSTHTCALLAGGAVRCWGDGENGKLGYGNTRSLGGDAPASAAEDVRLGGKAVFVGAGQHHTCAILASGAVRCWGGGLSGQLGLASTVDIGDDEHPADLPPVELGEPARRIAVGKSHTCAILASGAVRCWGNGFSGQLGNGNTRSIGDNEPPTAVAALWLGAPAVRIATGGAHTCALLGAGRLRCWGLLWGGWPAPTSANVTLASEVLPLPDAFGRLSLMRFPTDADLSFTSPTDL